MSPGTQLLLGLAFLAAASTLAATAPPRSDWAHTATAHGTNRQMEQVILFRHEIQDGWRLDRDDPYLPRLDAEASEARRLNYEFCQVAMSQRLATGQVRALRTDEPRTLFSLVVDGQRWREDPDETMLEEAACTFAAGDSRRRLQFPVYDEQGHLIGRWRWSRFVVE